MGPTGYPEEESLMFITLEGVEGAGKTSQVENIVAFFKARGYECVTTREPGGTAVGRQIRAILLDAANTGMDAGTELLLYVADRVQHIQSLIKPHLEAGRVVICDRYADATLVYQGFARGLDSALIRRLHTLMCHDLQPDVTILFDLEPELGLARAWQRIEGRSGQADESRFEQETLVFHQKVREGYLTLARDNPHRFSIIDARQDKQNVTRAIENLLAVRFPVLK
jgi:dTMP kinase